jgi:GGDEF domain-containing protein
MKLRPMSEWGRQATAEQVSSAISGTERCLTLLVEGAALNVPEIDPGSYKVFRASVSRQALQLADRLPDDDKMALIRTILHEFESYGKDSESVLKERTGNWRTLTTFLFRDLLASLGIGADSPEASTLGRQIPGLSSPAELRDWRSQAEVFLHPPDASGVAQGLASLKAANRSTANDNAAGLRGGGSAVEQLKQILAHGGSGFVALFRLSCLEVINQRFGTGAVEDCLMAVSAFLTASLHSDDNIYHWSDSSLLAILQGRPSEQILAAELLRIASQNRDTSINVAGRTIMLRVPLAFQLTPISRLRAAEDLYRLSTVEASKW